MFNLGSNRMPCFARAFLHLPGCKVANGDTTSAPVTVHLVAGRVAEEALLAAELPPPLPDRPLHLVGLGVALLDVVAVVGRDQRQTLGIGEIDQPAFHPSLDLEAVALQLEGVAVEPLAGRRDRGESARSRRCGIPARA